MKNQSVLEGLYGEFLTDLSSNNAVGCLLNCYIREYALLRNEVVVGVTASDSPLALKRAAGQGSQLIAIKFPESWARLLIRADRVSVFSRCRFVTKPYLKIPGKPWFPVQAEELCRFILRHLSLTETDHFNEELLEQVMNSIDVTTQFLHRTEKAAQKDDSFIESEQSLLWGHAMHPAPKSRHGVMMDDMLQCSPEIASSFQLFWFSINRLLVCQQGNKDFSVEQTLLKINPQQDEHKSMLEYPCHPWEVEHILDNPLIKRAIDAGLIVPLGFQGQKMQPTSSVRTLYHAELDVQLKLSIHVRLTNCVRKNAWYELESAVVLSELIDRAGAEMHSKNTHFKVMLEPAATSINLDLLQRGDESESVRDCRESFGILYRRNICGDQRLSYTPVLAASLFGWGREGDSIIEKRLIALCEQQQIAYSLLAERWFEAYIKPMLDGVFGYFFQLGIVFEPHLQNTLIGFTDGLPSCVWIRDLEGTKLLPQYWPEQKLTKLSDKARSSVYYSREKGWNRIAYCLLVNNFSEAIFHLAAGDNALEARLWQALREQISRWQQRNGSEPELQKLLDGEAIPCKTNFITRLHSKPDRNSSYITLANPMTLKRGVYDIAS